MFDPGTDQDTNHEVSSEIGESCAQRKNQTVLAHSSTEEITGGDIVVGL